MIKNEIIELANAPKDDRTIENVEIYINHLHNFDTSSDKFRYPTDKELNLHFSKKERFDITNVNKFFKDLLSFLSGVDAMLSEYKQIEAEFRPDIDY